MHLSEAVSARALLDAQGKILELLANGATLREVATDIAHLAESLIPDAMCAITVVNPTGTRLNLLAAPEHMHSYFAPLNGLVVGPHSGSTGTAAFRREPVIVTDTYLHPLWADMQYIVEGCGIRAAWALPILHSDNSVLGVLSLYCSEPREPGDWDVSAIDSCIKLIRLTMAADRRDQERRASDERWRIGAEAMGIGTFDANFETGVDKWSPLMRQILGVGEDEPQTINTFLKYVHPDDRDALIARLPQAHPSPDGRWREEFRYFRADTGELRYLVSKGCIIPDQNGQPVHAVGTIFDVTERHLHEDALKSAIDQAQAANMAKSKFLASMSHELRTPLNAIIGFSDLIRTGVFGQISPERYGAYIEDIYRSGTHLLSLINDVLDMAKIEAQKFELRQEVFPLRRLADTALMLVRPQAQAKNLAMNDSLPDDIILSADERVMRQVLVNLLSNAVKFTDAGGTITLFAEIIGNGGLALGVEDNGIGMTEEGVATALEPFGQVQMDVTAERSGTGLGLPLAKAMIEAHGATFHISSVLGSGTRIWGEFQPRDISTTVRQTG